MYQRSDIKEGMTVRSIDGEKLGRIFAVQEGEFLIEKGLFFPKDYVCSYSEISDIRDGEIFLMHGKEGLHRFSIEEERAVMAGTGGGAGVGPGAVGVPGGLPERSRVVPLRARDEEAYIRRPPDHTGERPHRIDITPDDPTLRRS